MDANRSRLGSYNCCYRFNAMKIQSLPELYEAITSEERIMVDTLRSIVIDFGNGKIREKIAYNVPYFFGNHGICIIWPASVPRGGIREGVLLGFWYGNMLADKEGYLTRGSNKQIFYRIFTSVEQIESAPIQNLLEEAMEYDLVKKKKILRRK